MKHELINIAKNLNIKVIYDCGSRDAKDGLFLLEFLEASELHVFECNPEALIECKKNIAASILKKHVKLVPKALADKTGNLKFYSINKYLTKTPHIDGNIGASSLYKANPKYPKEKYHQNVINVNSICLNDYTKNTKKPDLLWMDLQGAEARVLDGALRILKDVKCIHVEVSFRPMFIGQALFSDIHQRLKSHFRIACMDFGKWPRVPFLYKALSFGPWVGDIIYLNKSVWSDYMKSK